MLRRLASYLPFPIRQSLRSWKYRLQHVSSRFRPDEPEFDQLPNWVHPGDWVLDIGANVGKYTFRFSELVGQQGRVFAFEPITETAEILAAMATRPRNRNISILNIAVSERGGEVSFRVPSGAAGLPNYFQARVSGEGDRKVPCFALDDLPFPNRIVLVKIDVEEHPSDPRNAKSNRARPSNPDHRRTRRHLPGVSSRPRLSHVTESRRFAKPGICSTFLKCHEKIYNPVPSGRGFCENGLIFLCELRAFA